MAPDPLTTYAGTTVLEKAGDLIGKKVIGRWSDYRARRFIEEFVSAVSSDDFANIEAALETIVEDEKKSEALYDAFRRVVLSASRETGPRVLALHMAEAVAGQVNDTEVSDAVMTAAATLLDFEFEQFASFAVAHSLQEESFEDSLQVVGVVKIAVSDYDSNSRDTRRGTGPMFLRREVGSWAQKLELVGLVAQDISEEEFDYDEDGERHIDIPGTIRRMHHNLELREGCAHLLRLTRRVLASQREQLK